MIKCFRFSHERDHLVGLHQHAEGQFFILLQGSVAFETDEGERVMTSGRPCWVPPNLRHGVRSRGHMAGISLHVEAGLCEGLPQLVSIFRGSQFIDVLAVQMLSVADDDQRLLHLWHVLADELCAAEQDMFYLPVPKDTKLRRLTDQLAQNTADQRGLAEWAAEINMTQRTLVRKFRSETGMSFVEWRQRARVMQAIKLLSAGESVTSVALNVGYDSLSAFISVFKQITGRVPLQYRVSARTL